jgi:hypothetical protein
MNEDEWLACTEPELMLKYLQGKTSDRKLRLFACACCRLIWHLLIDERSRQAVLVAEQFADGQTTLENLFIAHEEAKAASQIAHKATFLPNDTTNEYPPSAAKFASDDLRFWDMNHAAGVCAADTEWAISVAIDITGYRGPNSRIASRKAQVSLLHDLFGNPFRPIVLDPSWLTSTALALAEGIYAEKAFDRMPILADALQDAGCDNEDILNHCRQPSEHVRGCWLVDRLLPKE